MSPTDTTQLHWAARSRGDVMIRDGPGLLQRARVPITLAAVPSDEAGPRWAPSSFVGPSNGSGNRSSRR
jgi:hypothetical protein